MLKRKDKKYKYLEWCHIPILKGVFVLVCSDDEEWITEKTQYEDGLVSYAHTLHGEFKGFDAYFIVLNLWKEDSPIFTSIITHEVNHLTRFLFEGRGWKITKHDEPFCYVSEWFVNKIYQFLEKNKLIKLIKNDNKDQ